MHFNVTAHPMAEWTAQQLREAFPLEQIPGYLLRDRDRIFGDEFGKEVKTMGIKEVLSAPRSPWQRAFVEHVSEGVAGDTANLRPALDTHGRIRREIPAASSTQPSPKIGIRRIFDDRPSRLIRRASIDGLEIPVIETKNKAPISSRARPATQGAADRLFALVLEQPRSKDR